MNRCPICKDHRTRRERELNFYTHNKLYSIQIKSGHKSETYYTCDKCKAMWWAAYVDAVSQV